jgi:diazepam-binding inhibitor (GABA receptor modulating acyl-CoA-binding protein)
MDDAASAKACFDDAVARSKKLPSQPPQVQLELYGLFKQATAGDVSGKRPGALDFRGRVKWDAWKKFEGTSAVDVMGCYVVAVERLEARA